MKHTKATSRKPNLNSSNKKVPRLCLKDKKIFNTKNQTEYTITQARELIELGLVEVRDKKILKLLGFNEVSADVKI